MFQLIETIRIEEGKLQNLAFHNARLNAARLHFFQTKTFVKIESIVKIPEDLGNSIFKCRITDDGKQINYTITPYQIRTINTLKIVDHESINYEYKTNGREVLNELYNQRANCDDILIFKNGLLTDSWVANVLLFDGKQWLTPKQPLLKGVQRAVLLHQNRIKEADITKEMLDHFEKIKLVNAMVTFEKAIDIEINKIFK